MENFESPMRHHVLGIAARYNDADCEEHGLATTIQRQDLSFNDVLYIAEQRALRTLAIEDPSLRHLLGNKSKPSLVPLTRAQQLRMAVFQSAILDGILIGWRGARLDAKDKEASRASE